MQVCCIIECEKVEITEKQLEVLRLVADGLNSEEIAAQLGNSKRRSMPFA
ncbi:MAG: hypothetical protein HC859_11585 [Bacteroidia bacterium]|nr:hypothetical protein [Bacteroidia bacterium]